MRAVDCASRPFRVNVGESPRPLAQARRGRHVDSVDDDCDGNNASVCVRETGKTMKTARRCACDELVAYGVPTRLIRDQQAHAYGRIDWTPPRQSSGSQSGT